MLGFAEEESSTYVFQGEGIFILGVETTLVSLQYANMGMKMFFGYYSKKVQNSGFQHL